MSYSGLNTKAPSKGVRKAFAAHEDWATTEENPRQGRQLKLFRHQFRQCDLSSYNLSRSAIEVCEFFRCDLTGVSFKGADLSKSQFKESCFRHTNFTQANLHLADLLYCDLGFANFFGANLEGANIYQCNFQSAKNILVFGPMPTSGRMVYAVRHPNGWMVQAGCFWGNLTQLKERVKVTNNCPTYLGIINLLRKVK